jgi:hypothetical protein
LICRRPNNGLDPTAGTVQVGGPGGGPGVAGSATGVVINTSYPFQSVGDARVTLGGPLGASVSLGGGVSVDGFVASGMVSGDVVFSDTRGADVSTAA